MAKYNAGNERIKRRYFVYMKEAGRQSEDSVDNAAAAIARFEAYGGWRDFKLFHIDHAVGFKRDLARQPGQSSGKPLSKATLNAILSHLKRFFFWLADQEGFRGRIKYSEAEYFNLTEKEARIATAKRPRAAPTFEQLHHALGAMPAETEIQRRDRAVFAFTMITGARDSATASFKLKHIDIANRAVFQDAREVKTKFSKTFTTYFFPVGGDALAVLADWVTHLRTVRLWGEEQPLFPATELKLGPTGQFEAAGVKPEHWSNADPIRAIFKNAFAGAGLPYFNPHSVRNALVRLGQMNCKGPEEFKAWSQNLGHESVMTTFTSYGTVSPERQSEIIRDLGAKSDPEVVDEALCRAFKKVLTEMRATPGASGSDGFEHGSNRT